MKNNIAIIAPFKELAINAMEVCENWNNDIHVSVGNSTEAVNLARQLFQNGIDIIISRDEALSAVKSAINIPTVEIPISSWDVFLSLKEAKEYGKNIGLLDLNHVFYQKNELEELLDINMIQLQSPLEENLLSSIDIVIGRHEVNEITKEYGLKSIVVNSSLESIKHAINQAHEISTLKKKEWINYEKINSVLQNTYEGIISVDQRGVINFINKHAREILKIYNQVIGKNYLDVIPFINFQGALQYNQKTIDEPYQLKQDKIIINIVPINIRTDTVGAVCTLRKFNFSEMNFNNPSKIGNGLIANHTFSNIITESECLLEAIKKAERFAAVDSNVFIIGETGTGKELFAQSLHNASQRKEGSFVSVNCATLTETLLESELFGYEDGAFTGAKKGGKIGLFELANGGTLFLDEIGEISMNVQARLLRVLQEKEIMRVGGNKVIKVDVRVIAATNKDLSELVKSGEFRQDLYHRINVLKIELPPLRERRKDKLLLVNWFTDIYSGKFNYEKPVYSEETIKFFESYQWPGNIRELENMIERLVVLKNGNIVDVDEVKSLIDYSLDKDSGNQILLNIDQPFCEIEKQIIKEVLKTCRNKEEAAEKLGIGATTIWRKMKDISK